MGANQRKQEHNSKKYNSTHLSMDEQQRLRNLVSHPASTKFAQDSSITLLRERC
jgi:hypothetical protein